MSASTDVPDTAATPTTPTPDQPDGPAPPAGPAAPSGGRRRLTLALASIGSFMVALDLLVVTIALDRIRQDLGASTAALQWSVTAYSLSFAALLMTGAALGDRFGRRRMFATGLAVFVAGSAAAALSGGVGALIASRVVQGVGAALVLPLGLTMVAAAFPPERRGAAIGTLEGISGLAVIVGPLFGGAVVQHLAWEWVFWINVPIGLVAIPLVLVGVDESRGPDTGLDGRGMVLVTGAALGVVWGLVRGNEVGWTDPEILVALGGGAALAAAFVAWERRARAPMLPTRFFRSRAFSAGATASFLLSASLYGTVFFMAQYLQAGLGHDAMAAGLRQVPWTATLLVVAPLAGAAADRWGPRPVLAAGLGLQAVGLAWLAAIATPDLSYSVMVLPMVVSGVGCSAAIPVSQTAVVGSVQGDDVGKAAGANNMIQELGGSLGVAVAVAVFTVAGSYAGVQAVADGFAAAILSVAVLAAVGFVAALAIPSGTASGTATAGTVTAGPTGARTDESGAAERSNRR
jgi:EmrB/QacA subfamily drug resistance transporter